MTQQPQGDALSQALMRQRPGLAGHVHYINGHPWCDGINHTTMCSDDSSDEWMARPAGPPSFATSRQKTRSRNRAGSG